MAIVMVGGVVVVIVGVVVIVKLGVVVVVVSEVVMVVTFGIVAVVALISNLFDSDCERGSLKRPSIQRVNHRDRASAHRLGHSAVNWS